MAARIRSSLRLMFRRTMATSSTSSDPSGFLNVEANGRLYRKPTEPTVVVCLDGNDPSYLASARSRSIMPCYDAMAARGAEGLCEAQVPTFTNPNNTAMSDIPPPSVPRLPFVCSAQTAASPHCALSTADFLDFPAFRVTGVAASVNGICGNYYYDGTKEVMMNSPEFLRCDTLLARLAAHGAPAG